MAFILFYYLKNKLKLTSWLPIQWHTFWFPCWAPSPKGGWSIVLLCTNLFGTNNTGVCLRSGLEEDLPTYFHIFLIPPFCNFQKEVAVPIVKLMREILDFHNEALNRSLTNQMNITYIMWIITYHWQLINKMDSPFQLFFYTIMRGLLANTTRSFERITH